MRQRELSLKKCTKESCERCDMGYILSEHVKPIMQCLTNDIKDYYMALLTTKCLNTAVAISFFMLGNKGIKIANFCDSVEVQNRHEQKKDDNVVLIQSLRRNILNKQTKFRQLFYILMTDSTFPHDDNNNRHFPGHVFIIEKIPGDPEPTYYFHQSYINKYDYNGHIKRNNNTLSMSWLDIKRMMEQIHYTLLNPIWDENTVKYWKQITFVDTKHMLGAKSGGKMFLCWKKAKLTDCIGRLESYTNEKLKQISKMKISELSTVYGEASSYDSEQTPLTVSEMKDSLETLRNKIIISKQKV